MTKIYSPKKLIEVALPLDDINAAAARAEGAMTIIQHNILSKQMVSAPV